MPKELFENLEQNSQPQYTEKEKSFLRNIYLTRFIIGDGATGAQAYETEYLWGAIKGNQSWTGVSFIPGSPTAEEWRNEGTRKNQLKLFEKFTGLEYDKSYLDDSSYNYNTVCGAPVNVFFNVKGDLKAAEAGVNKMVQTANAFAKAELSQQEGKVLSNVINIFRQSDCSCSGSVKNIDGAEGIKIEKLYEQLTKNQVKGAGTLSANDITNLSQTTGIDIKTLNEAVKVAGK